MLKIYNTITKQKQEFKPIQPGKVNMYVCGMTVYDHAHLGHARANMVVFDLIRRYLQYSGYDVTYVRNITDIDDKIIQRAQENNEDIHTLTARVIESMQADERALGSNPPDLQPKATEHIPQIIHMIERLMEKNLAYQGENGDVYFKVTEFENYGALSHKSIDDLQVGARIAIDEAKLNPLDFVLWKMAKPGEPSWSSPWGEGRPGWHIECSAMSTHCLGDHFDIHGGGNDLKFPHHENELAQSEGATGKTFVNTWVHVGFVQINKEKMSKSLGNFFTIREVLAEYHPEIVRYFLLASHYRSPINYSTESLAIARAALDRLYTSLRGLPVVEAEIQADYDQRFRAAMDDDFNTPEAMAVLFDLTHEINREKTTNPEKAAELAVTLRQLANVLGIGQLDPEAFLQNVAGDDSDAEEIEALIAQRNQARADKDWATADTIRQQLDDMGVVLEDGAGGTTWRRA